MTFRLYLLTMMSVLAYAQTSGPSRDEYLLGTDDRIHLRAADIKEIDEKTFSISKEGQLDLPLVGLVPAAGRPVESVRSDLQDRPRQWRPRCLAGQAAPACPSDQPVRPCRCCRRPSRCRSRMGPDRQGTRGR